VTLLMTPSVRVATAADALADLTGTETYGHLTESSQLGKSLHQSHIVSDSDITKILYHLLSKNNGHANKSFGDGLGGCDALVK